MTNREEFSKELIREIVTEKKVLSPETKYSYLFARMLASSWRPIFEEADNQGIINLLLRILDNITIHEPKPDLIFYALERVPYHKVRVVIMGQDPYPGKDKNGVSYAVGASFAIPKEASPIPSSFLKVMLESKAKSQDLENWMNQGVLLLNASLTLHESSERNPNIWTPLINMIITNLAKRKDVLFLLWGNSAKSFEDLIKQNNGNYLSAGHPSSRNITNNFMGCRHFELVNQFYRELGMPEIKW